MKEAASKRTKTHGATGTKLFDIWRKMLDRCYNPKSTSYKWYGAKGITVSPEWHDFETFKVDNAGFETTTLTIDRVDNSQGYSKENCRWATWKVQQNNRSSNRILELNGKSQTMQQWADEVGINFQTIYARVGRLGWDIARALTTPAARTGRGV